MSESAGYYLNDDICSIKGIGSKKKEQLSAAGIETVGDLLDYYPVKYKDRRNIVRAMDARLAQRTGDANAWRAHLERESMGASQQRMRVHATFQLAIQYERDAREARATGDEARARELEAIAGEKYARVARFGGTLACARQAQAWLDARQA